jgi:hypothetical protein
LSPACPLTPLLGASSPLRRQNALLCLLTLSQEIRLELLPRARQLLTGRSREEAPWAEVNAPDRCIRKGLSPMPSILPKHRCSDDPTRLELGPSHGDVPASGGVAVCLGVRPGLGVAGQATALSANFAPAPEPVQADWSNRRKMVTENIGPDKRFVLAVI